MAEPTIGTTPDGEAPTGPVVRDRRRLDPETGQVRAGAAEAGAAGNGTAEHAGGDEGVADAGLGAAASSPELEAAIALADERLADLQRLQAEYVNYRRRVERDRDVA